MIVMDSLVCKKDNLKGLALLAFCGTLLIFLLRGPVFAQIEPFSVASPPTPVGSGARAIGMAGAFVAIADDATASSWNPAGLSQLQTPEVSGAFSWENRSKRRYALTSPYLNGEEDDNVSDINYLSMVYPFSLFSRPVNIVIAVNYQKLYDFHNHINVNLPDSFIIRDARIEFQSEGSLYTLSPAMSVQINQDLSCGFTINIWSDEWTQNSGWKNIYSTTYFNNNSQKPINLYIKEEYKNFRGLNANLGLLYRITPKLKIGLVYKIPFRAHFDYRYYYKYNKVVSNEPGIYYGKIESLDFPSVYGLGAAYRVSDAWTISCDVTRRDWDKLLWRNDKGDAFGLYSTAPDPLERISRSIDPTYSVRFGVEYLKIMERTVIPFRSGIFYDPRPSVDSPHNEYGISLGSGASIGDLIIDFAYEYRVSHDISGAELEGWDEGANAYEDKKQHSFLISMIYHF